MGFVLWWDYYYPSILTEKSLIGEALNAAFPLISIQIVTGSTNTSLKSLREERKL